MLIPFGVLSAAGAGGEIAIPAFELIATASGTGSSGTITFSSIPQDYKHLQIRYTAKASSSETLIRMRLQANPDVNSFTHQRHSLFGNESGVSSTAGSSGDTDLRLLDAMASSTTANRVSAGIIDILDYSSTTKNKTVRALYGQIGLRRIYIASGLIDLTNATTSISLRTSDNFTTLSRFSLYGIKG